MSIATELEELQANVQAAEDAVVEKGGTVAGGAAGLAASIDSIPATGIPESEWGVLEYYDKTVPTADIGYTQGCTVNSVDAEKLAAFYAENEITELRWQFYDATWEIWGERGRVEVPQGEMLATTGIDVVIDGGWADMEVAVTDGPAPDAKLVRTALTETEAQSFDFSQGKTISGVVVPAGAVYRFICGHNNTSLGDDAFAFTQIVDFDTTYADSLTTIGDNFLYGAAKFAAPKLNLSHVRSIGDYFLHVDKNGYSEWEEGIPYWDGELVLSEVETIGDSFMGATHLFNHSIILPNIKNIGDHFLSFNTSFNSDVVLSGGFQSFGAGFLHQCRSFNHPIAIPTGMKVLKERFLEGCASFNQPITFPEGLTTIEGTSFMEGCSSFCQNISFPDSLTSVDGWHFMQNCAAMTKNVYVNNAQMTSPEEAFRCDDTQSPLCQQGCTISGANKNTWVAGISINKSWVRAGE